jgi:hypothetical protein
MLAARLMAVVVLPTPPFWFAIAIVLPIFLFFFRSKNTLIAPKILLSNGESYQQTAKVLISFPKIT